LAAAGRIETTLNSPGVVMVWDTATWQDPKTFRHHQFGVTALAYNPAADIIASAGYSYVPAGNRLDMLGEIKLWDDDTGEVLAALNGLKGMVGELAFSHDGHLLAASVMPAAEGGTPEVQVWDVGERKELSRWSYIGVPAFAFSDLDRTFAVLAQEPRGIRDRIRLVNLRENSERVIESGLLSASRLAFGHSGELLAASGGSRDRLGFLGEIRLWNASSGARLEGTARGHRAPITAMAFDPAENRLLSVGEDRTAIVWSKYGSHELYRFQGHTQPIACLAFHPQGREFATGTRTYDGQAEIKVWDASTPPSGPVIDLDSGVTAVAYSPDGALLATADGGGSVHLFEAGSGKPAGPPRKAGHLVNALAFSPDGALLAAGGGPLFRIGESGGLTVWKVTSAPQDKPAWEHGDVGTVLGLAFTPDGKALTAACWRAAENPHPGAGKTGVAPKLQREWLYMLGGGFVTHAGVKGELRSWDAASGHELTVMGDQGRGVTTLAYDPSGARFALAWWDFDPADPLMPRSRVVLHPAKAGATPTVVYEAPGLILGLAFSPDGGRLAVTSPDQAVRIWNLGYDPEPLILRGHDARVTAVAWHPAGDRLASAGDDHTVRVWDTASGEELLTLVGHTNSVNALAFRPGGRDLTSGGADTDVRVWRSGED
jgi:WD40 repeat protein